MLESNFANVDQALKDTLDSLIDTGETLLSAYKLTLCDAINSVLDTATALENSIADIYISELDVLLNKLELLPESLLDEKILLPQKYSGFISQKHSGNFKTIDLISILITLIIGALSLAQKRRLS